MMLIVPYDSHEGGEERGLGEEEGQGHRGQVPVQGVRRNVAMHLINVLCGRTHILWREFLSQSEAKCQ